MGSLKNMLLVMDTAGIFHHPDTGYTDLWQVTWDRIDVFLPNLKQELFKETQQPEHLMPPAVPELDRMGTTIGIAANPLYAAAVPPTQAQQPLITSPVPAAASPIVHVPEPVPVDEQVPVAEEKPVLTEESVNPEPAVIETMPKYTQERTSILNSDENQESRVPPANGNLLFDHNVLQGIPTLDPISVPSSESSTAPPLTQSDSLAAVIADLNKTLSQAPVPVTSSATPIPEFTGASSFFQSSSAEAGSVFDEIEKSQPDLR